MRLERNMGSMEWLEAMAGVLGKKGFGVFGSDVGWGVVIDY